MSQPETDVIRLAIVNDYELVVAGIATMLAGERHRVQVIGIDTDVDQLQGVDLILYDTFGPTQSSMDNLEELIRRSHVPVVVYTWKLRADLADEAVSRGAAGYLSKAMSGTHIVDALDEVRRGGVVISPDVTPAEDLVGGDWPGRDLADLSPRESEVLTMIASGLSNQEIAERSYLSINSVKTYIRTAYRKIGVTTRSAAVIWALQSGFDPRYMASAEGEGPLPGARF